MPLAKEINYAAYRAETHAAPSEVEMRLVQLEKELERLKLRIAMLEGKAFTEPVQLVGNFHLNE